MNKKIFAIVIAAELAVSAALGTVTIIHTVNQNKNADPNAGFVNEWTDETVEETLQADAVTGRASTVPETKPTAISGKNLISDGKTTYKIVTSETVTTAEGFAASELQYFLEQATGCKLDIVTESQLGSGSYISIGATEVLTSSNVNDHSDELGFAGCSIVTKDDNVYIVGADSTGILNGVYQFLHYSIDYEAYSPEEIYFKTGDDVPLYAFNYAHTPTTVVATSSYSMRQIKNAARLKMWDGRWGAYNIDGGLWAGGYFAHSFTHLLDPANEPGKSHQGDINTEDGWYSNGQLCLTKVSAQDAMAEAVANVLKASASNMIMLGGMDNGSSCGCNTCKAEAAIYGGVGGVYARFLNAVADKVEAILGEDEEFYIYGMSYNAYSLPPVTQDGNGNYIPVHESVILNDHAGMMVTTMGNCHFHPMDSEDMCDFATQFTGRFEGWASLTDNLVAYTYGINFSNYMITFNDFNAIADNIEFLGNQGYSFVYDQTSGNNEINGFMELKTYIKSKASWDSSSNEYADKYINDFFVNYYKVAAVPMKKFYDKLRNHYALIQQTRGEYDVSIYDSSRYAVKSSWPITVVNEFQKYIDEAYEAIDSASVSESMKTIVRRRVMGEELMLRYIRLTWYKSMYTNKEYEAEYAKFIEDCKYCGTTALSEGNNI